MNAPAAGFGEVTVKLMGMYGQLQGVELAVCEARWALETRAAPGDDKLVEHLFWLQYVLCRAQGLALLNMQAHGGIPEEGA